MSTMPAEPQSTPASRRAWLGVVRRIVVFLIVVAVGWMVIGCAFQRRIIFPRHVVTPPAGAADSVAALEQVWLDTPAGKVEAWYLPAYSVSSLKPGPAVIFAHGNAELIDHNAAMLGRYREWGISVLLVEYRGYGRSAGKPSQAAITSDFVAAYDQLVQRPEVDADRIFFHGRSIGGGVVCSLARQRKPVAIILESTFTSITDMAAGYFFPAFLVSDPFDNAGLLADYDGPVLLLHGRYDRIIPYRHSQSLVTTTPNAKLVTYDCDHNDFPPDFNVYWDDIESFLRDAGLVRAR